MVSRMRTASLSVLLLCAFSSAPARGQGSSKPKVRAITGFVRLDRAQLAQQVGDALTVLRSARREFEKQG